MTLLLCHRPKIFYGSFFFPRLLYIENLTTNINALRIGWVMLIFFSPSGIKCINLTEFDHPKSSELLQNRIKCVFFFVFFLNWFFFIVHAIFKHRSVVIMVTFRMHCRPVAVQMIVMAAQSNVLRCKLAIWIQQLKKTI